LMQEKEDLLSIGKVSMWYSEKQCVITGDEDALFEETDIRWWDGYLDIIEQEAFLHITHLNRRKTSKGNWELISLDEERIIPVNTYMGVDPASSLRRKADFSTTVPIAVDHRKNIYMLPYFEKRVRPTVHAKQITDKFLEIRPKKTYIETVAYQESLRNMVKDWMEENNEYIPGIGKKWQPRNEKDDRLQDLQRFTKQHKLHLQPGMHRLLDEMLLFPRGNKNLLDGMWYATRSMSEPYHDIQSVTDDSKHISIAYYGEQRSKWMQR